MAFKYLRRTDNAPAESSDQALRDFESLLSEDVRDGSVREMAGAVLRKIVILQDRAKKLKMVRTLAQGNAPWVPYVFLDLLGDGIEEIRDLAVRELTRRDDWPSAALYERLDRPPWYAKSACLRILAERKEPESVPHIKRLIDDPNADVKRSAALALGAIGGREARALLVRLARDESHYVRTAAEEMLERLCDFKFI
ncbi:MAG: HEAT repeat domain-containing protein [Candidatus Aminicenantales bacterium]